MQKYFFDLISSLQSGSMAETAIGFFDLSFLIFIVSAVAYTIFLMRRSNAIWAIGFGALCVGIVTMTVALVFRWIAAGWDHPPWTNLYESLVFFSWGLVTSYAVVEIKFRIKIVGAFIVPLVMIAMGIASLSGNKEITPLMPALQSIWLHFHVFGATVSYSMFIVAFAFAVLYLFRDGLPLPYFHMASDIFNMLAIIAVSRGAVFVLKFPLTAGALLEGGQVAKATDLQMIPEQFRMIELPGMGSFLFIIMVLFAVSVAVSFTARKATRENELKRALFAHLFPMILFTLAFVRIILLSGAYSNPENPQTFFTLKYNIYGFALLASAWFFGVSSLILHTSAGPLREYLPNAKVLDNLAYKSIIVAVPILSFVIISGAIWANKAWGRYWGWDPKETSSLVTWIVYVIYLHTRVTKGWMGRKTAYIAIAGFASVIFTYLGVNLVLSGLHSYATG